MAIWSGLIGLKPKRIIQSLISQMINESPNNGRIEFRTKDREYFSIAVHPDEPPSANEGEKK